MAEAEETQGRRALQVARAKSRRSASSSERAARGSASHACFHRRLHFALTLHAQAPCCAVKERTACESGPITAHGLGYGILGETDSHMHRPHGGVQCG